ncbi:MAG TPA: class I SAM-dependent methyltransferase [Dehalococcoidia bacterium]|nr:class I SAM-dependent methyltransferase [Dehalococcoidia bacterium]
MSKSVLIGVPVQRGQIEIGFMTSLLATTRNLSRNGIYNRVITNESSVISYSRNCVAERAGLDYLMFIDTDIKFPPWGVKRLIERDVDIIGGLYFRKTPDHRPLVFKFNDNRRFQEIFDFPNMVFECDGVATGFMLIKRKVFEAFHEARIAPFDMGAGPIGKEEGEDLAFCRRARDMGFKVFCDPTIPLGHIGHEVFTRQHFDNVLSFHQWKEKNETYDNNIDGWMSKTELNWLYKSAAGMNTIAEVGSWKGRSTHALLSGCQGTVFAVDHFQGSAGEEDVHKEAKEKDISEIFNLNVSHFPNLRTLKCSSVEAAGQFKDQSIDMVFIDGGHGYDEVKADIAAWLPKARKMICGHDYNIPSVQDAVTEVFGIPDTAGSIWIKNL